MSTQDFMFLELKFTQHLFTVFEEMHLQLRRGSQSIALNQDSDVLELFCRKFAFQSDQTNLRLFSLLIKFRHNIWRPQQKEALPKSTI